MSKEKNIGINAVLNVIKSALSVLFPLITYPYALRVLGAESIGKVTYGSSIVSYFALLAMLGVSTYAVREGAKKKDNKAEFNQFADEIFTINVITTIIAYALLVIALLLVSKFQNYTKLILLQSSVILLTTLGVDWINTVYEDFLLITVRSIISHIVTMAMLFIFVHRPEDYYIYAALTVVNNGIVCVSNWFYIRKYAKVKITLRPNLKKHLKPLIILFANAVTVTIYVNFDTIMLGWMKGDVYTGLYAVSVRIYSIIKNLLAAIYAVAIPRLAFYIGNNNLNEYKKLYSNLWGYLTILLIPSGVGLICIAEEVMRFMGGEEFAASTLALQILAVSLVFAIFGGLVTACLNVTLGREKDNLIATVISALLNCGLNLIFIPLFAHYGAAITTLISEAFVFAFCLIRVPSKGLYMDKNDVITSLVHAGIGSVLIVVITVFYKCFIQNYLVRMGLIIATSVAVYLMFLLLVKDEYAIQNLDRIKRKVLKK